MAGFAVESSDELHRQDGVAAEIEEVVPHADAVAAKERGGDASHQFLARTYRRAEACGPGDIADGVREGVAVELAVGGEGKLIDPDEVLWSHVLGQMRREVFPQRRYVGRGARRRYEVRNQSLVAWMGFSDGNRAVGNGFVSREHRLDLARLDPKATEFHLIVGSAEEFELAASSPFGAISGSVEGAVRPGFG